MKDMIVLFGLLLCSAHVLAVGKYESLVEQAIKDYNFSKVLDRYDFSHIFEAYDDVRTKNDVTDVLQWYDFTRIVQLGIDKADFTSIFKAYDDIRSEEHVTKVIDEYDLNRILPQYNFTNAGLLYAEDVEAIIAEHDFFPAISDLVDRYDFGSIADARMTAQNVVTEERAESLLQEWNTQVMTAVENVVQELGTQMSQQVTDTFSCQRVRGCVSETLGTLDTRISALESKQRKSFIKASEGTHEITVRMYRAVEFRPAVVTVSSASTTRMGGSQSFIAKKFLLSYTASGCFISDIAGHETFMGTNPATVSTTCMQADDFMDFVITVTVNNDVSVVSELEAFNHLGIENIF